MSWVKTHTENTPKADRTIWIVYVKILRNLMRRKAGIITKELKKIKWKKVASEQKYLQTL